MPASVERDQYDGLTITLHWLIAALVVILFTLGKVMTNIGNGLADLALKFQLYQLHKSLGFILLALMVVRIGWALARRAPAPIAFRSAIERIRRQDHPSPHLSRADGVAADRLGAGLDGHFAGTDADLQHPADTRPALLCRSRRR